MENNKSRWKSTHQKRRITVEDWNWFGDG